MPDDDDEAYQRALEEAPQATLVQVYFCGNPNCYRPHVVLKDERGWPFAQFVLPDRRQDGSGSFLEDLMNAAYQSAVMREGR